MKIVDAFIFYNEVKMLFFRLTELYDVVDFFVIVEATNTFVGNKKELYFEQVRHHGLFERFMDKIIHVVVGDMPNTGDAWDNEAHQRKCIDHGISQLQLADDDIILICDCDEIPDCDALHRIRRAETVVETAKCLEMDMYYYNLTCKGTTWHFAKIIPYSEYKTTRDADHIRHLSCDRIPASGWHFSYFGDVEFIQNKLKNFSHQEYNNSNYLDAKKIAAQIDTCDDLFFRDNHHTHGFRKIPLHENTYLPKNHPILETYRHQPRVVQIIYGVPDKYKNVTKIALSKAVHGRFSVPQGDGPGGRLGTFEVDPAPNVVKHVLVHIYSFSDTSVHCETQQYDENSECTIDFHACDLIAAGSDPRP